MIRLTLAAATTLIALATAMPAQAIGPWLVQNGISLNGLELNGLALNGRNMQGRTWQGISRNGVESHEATGGVTLLAVELAQ